MKQIFTPFALLPLCLSAQTTWEVEAGGSTSGSTAPYYDPMMLTIEVGDAVHWEAITGSHNVYALQSTFPSNPEGFTSGDPSFNLDYTRTFTIPGTYMYHCTQNGHSATQHGTIVVELSSQVQENDAFGELTMFPVPATGQLTIGTGGAGLARVEVITTDGRLLKIVPANGAQRVTIDLDGLATGRYFVRLTDGEGHRIVRPFLRS
jgi:plastocyanin